MAAGVDDAVELFGADVAGVERGFTQGTAGAVGVVRDGGCLVVADDRRERGDQHQGLTDVFVDPLLIQIDPVDAEGLQFLACVAENPRRVQEVVDHDGAHRIEFEVAPAAFLTYPYAWYTSLGM
jgi:hypothetical protein